MSRPKYEGGLGIEVLELKQMFTQQLECCLIF
jgi:hypothetical protein